MAGKFWSLTLVVDALGFAVQRAASVAGRGRSGAGWGVDKLSLHDGANQAST